MNVIPASDGSEPGLTFTPVTIPAGQETMYTITKPAGRSEGTPFGQHAVRNKNGIVVGKRFNVHKDIIARSPTNETITVVSISEPYAVFGWDLKMNPVAITTLAPVSPPVPLAPAPAIPSILPPFTANPATAYLSPAPATPVAAAHAAAVAQIQAKAKTNRTHLYNTLCPFVAKQLFDLAVLRKEQCPVTMEDFSAGHTAVMPCGHLFVQFAIEESFKKEPGKCPWCRQAGKPTYV